MSNKRSTRSTRQVRRETREAIDANNRANDIMMAEQLLIPTRGRRSGWHPRSSSTHRPVHTDALDRKRKRHQRRVYREMQFATFGQLAFVSD